MTIPMGEEPRLNHVVMVPLVAKEGVACSPTYRVKLDPARDGPSVEAEYEWDYRGGRHILFTRGSWGIGLDEADIRGLEVLLNEVRPFDPADPDKSIPSVLQAELAAVKSELAAMKDRRCEDCQRSGICDCGLSSEDSCSRWSARQTTKDGDTK